MATYGNHISNKYTNKYIAKKYKQLVISIHE